MIETIIEKKSISEQRQKKLKILEGELNDFCLKMNHSKERNINSEIAAGNIKRYDDLLREKRVLEYLIKELPGPGERIAEPMNPHCKISVVIPCCGEELHILRSMESLVCQKGVGRDQFEIVIVVFELNPGSTNISDTKETNDSIKIENMEISDLIDYIKRKNVDPVISEREKEVIEKIKKSENKIYILYIASSNHGVSIGEARNMGTAEAVSRFYEQQKRNGLIVQIDADAKVEEDYIRNIINIFDERDGLVGLSGREVPGIHREQEQLSNFNSKISEIEYCYDGIMKFLISKNEPPESVFFEDYDSYGSNIVSPAFETAVIGGVPKQNKYEIAEFAVRLSKIGIVDRYPGITLERVYGHPLGSHAAVDSNRAKYAGWPEGRETIEVRSVEYYNTCQKIKSGVDELICTGELNQETLGRVLRIGDYSLLSEEELSILCEELEGAVFLEKEIETSTKLRLFFEKIYTTIDKRIPNTSLKNAIPFIKKKLLIDEERVVYYEFIKERIIEEPRELMRIIDNLSSIYYENKPPDINPGSLLELMRSNKEKIGINEDLILVSEVRGFDLFKISNILAISETKEDAASLLKLHFFDRSSGINEGDSLGNILLEMHTMKEIIRNNVIDSTFQCEMIDEHLVNRQKISIYQEKIDLRDVTIIIATKIDSQDRIDNIQIVISYLKKYFITNIIVLEADTRRHLFFHEKNIKYIFIKDSSSSFHRTRYMNIMINEVETPILVNLDSDILLDEYQLSKGIMLVRNKILDVCYPYNGNFLNLQDKSSIKNSLNLSKINARMLPCLNNNSFGGIVIFSTAVYKQGGMENENIKGWGGNDIERFIRFQKLGFKIARIQGPSFHLAHRRGTNSSFRNPYFYESQKEFEFVRLMSKVQLKNYIKIWSWVN